MFYNSTKYLVFAASFSCCQQPSSKRCFCLLPLFHVNTMWIWQDMLQSHFNTMPGAFIWHFMIQVTPYLVHLFGILRDRCHHAWCIYLTFYGTGKFAWHIVSKDNVWRWEKCSSFATCVAVIPARKMFVKTHSSIINLYNWTWLWSFNWNWSE